MRGHYSSNKYEIKDENTEIYDTRGNCTVIDTEDLERIKTLYWYLDSRGYWISMRDRKTTFLHRIIMNCPDDMEVDHIEQDPSDNRKSMLRICEHHVNMLNRKYSVKNKLGIVGVYTTINGKFRANITVKSKQIHLGTFNSIEEAIKARKDGEKKYYSIGGCSYE